LYVLLILWERLLAARHQVFCVIAAKSRSHRALNTLFGSKIRKIEFINFRHFRHFIKNASTGWTAEVKLKNYHKENLRFIPHSRPTLGEEEMRAVSEVIKSGQIAEGEVVKRFEKSFADKMGVREAVAVSSGTAALHLVLLAMGIGPADEVIIPSYVCSALLNAVQYVGATPVLAETDPLTYNMDPEDVQRRITLRTRAIVVPHLFGLAADLDKILKLNVPVIEDCAQAVGATYHHRPLGTFGVAAIFSFYATKVMTTGEGGMIIANSPQITEQVKDLRTYDEKQTYRLRYNYKMTDFQAALGEIQLTRLDDFIKSRRKIARQYVKHFEPLDLKLPAGNAEHIYYRFVVGMQADCAAFVRELVENGVGCARPVFLPLHRQLNMKGYPVTEKTWKTALSIPIYPSLHTKEVEQIIDVFMDTYEKMERSSAI
jgi:perosamine synthetase